MSLTRRIILNTPSTVRHTFYGDEGLLDPDANAATVTIVKADGSSLVATAAATRVSQGLYSYTLDGVAALDHLTLTWAGTFSGRARSEVDYADIVGGHYVALAELRALPNLSDTSKFTTDELRDARAWFETRFEDYTRRAWVPRYKRLTMYATGEQSLTLPDVDLRTVRSVTVDGAALASSVLTALAYTGSTLRLNRGASTAINASTALAAPFGYYGSPLVVAYEYGADTCPDDIHDAALIAIRARLLNDQTGRPMLSVADGAGGVTRFAYPGDGRPFGIPEVDVVANDRRRKDDQFESVAMSCG